MSFTTKKIDLTFRLGKTDNGAQRTFAGGEYDTVTVSGLRVEASIEIAGAPAMGQASVRVHGMDTSIMNQLSSLVRTVNGRFSINFNDLIIKAGDDESGMAIVFQGQVTTSAIDLSQAPDSSLYVQAVPGGLQRVMTAAPHSYPGTADAALIMRNLAIEGGLDFENSGVSVQLSTPYLHGDLFQQMESCAMSGGFNWLIDQGKLCIWPMGGSRGGVIPVVSAQTGMYGYPTNNGAGVNVKTLFNPQLGYGQAVQVESSIANASGRFVILQLGHELQSETPNGAWFSHFNGWPADVSTQ